MIVWSGLGFLVAVITFGSCLLANVVFDAQFGDGYYSAHSWTIGVALIVGGLLSSAIGFVLKSKNNRELIDPQTGQRVVINRSHHTFFFIPMHWAGVVIAVIGAGLAIKDALM